MRFFSGQKFVRSATCMTMASNHIDIIHRSLIQVPFLNLMSNLVERSGGVLIRIGGNTQEFATMVSSLEDGKTFDKEDSGSTQTVCGWMLPRIDVTQQPLDQNTCCSLYDRHVLHGSEYLVHAKCKMVFRSVVEIIGFILLISNIMRYRYTFQRLG